MAANFTGNSSLSLQASLNKLKKLMIVKSNMIQARTSAVAANRIISKIALCKIKLLSIVSLWKKLKKA